MVKRSSVLKRKAAAAKASKNAPKKAKKSSTLGDDAFDWSAAGGDDVIASDSDGDASGEEAHRETDGEDDDEAEQRETADEKRIRLAKEYLDKIAQQEAADQSDDGDDEDGDGAGVDRVAARLHRDALEASGKLFKEIAHEYEDFEFDHESIRFLRGHRLSPTCVCLTDDGRTAYTGSKDGSLLRWDLAQQSKKRLRLPEDDVADARTDQQRAIMSVAVSTDGKFVATGGADKLVRVWDGAKDELLESFSGHRDAVSAVCFRQRTHSLFSGSLDRSIKHWNLTEMGYVETLFGHQSEVNGLDSLYRERLISCGRDRSVRMWKIPEETQLVFYGNSGSMDCVKMVTEEYYVTGGDDGSLSLWFNGRKKPVCVIANAHGGKWISSVTVLPRSDLVASGASDGFIRLWRADLKARTLTSVGAIPVEGFVNGLSFDSKARFLVAAMGQEHRLGRWERMKKARNGLALIALPSIDPAQDGMGGE